MIIQGSTPMLAILKAASPRRYSHLDPGAGLRGLFILFPLPRVLRGCARSRMFASTGLAALLFAGVAQAAQPMLKELDRKSTRLNSSHLVISYAVFCLKKKKTDAAPIPRSPDLPV